MTPDPQHSPRDPRGLAAIDPPSRFEVAWADPDHDPDPELTRIVAGIDLTAADPEDVEDFDEAERALEDTR